MGKLNPMKIIEYCNNFLPDQFKPGREFSGKSTNSLRTIPKIKAKTLEPIMGKKVPNNIAQSASTNAIASPNPLFFIFSIPFKKVSCLLNKPLSHCRVKGQHLLQPIQNLFSISLGYHPLIQ